MAKKISLNVKNSENIFGTQQINVIHQEKEKKNPNKNRIFIYLDDELATKIDYIISIEKKAAPLSEPSRTKIAKILINLGLESLYQTHDEYKPND